ncbi:MAG: FAD-binding oxidoreductase [Verrucomicrobia bacterium]|nr:FAD-binding oxidoreductase [Verrucomicrobiota bacterium]
MIPRKWRTWLWMSLAAGLALVVLTVGPAMLHLVRVTWNDADQIEVLPPGYVDDVSRMNKTKVSEVWEIPLDEQAAEQQLRELLVKAQADGLRISIAGARHSMGGHTIYPGGVSINMLPFNRMKLNPSGTILHVQAGARWSEIIPYLEQHGRSVEVMQSDNSFTVGGSLSVNCHGWQYGRPPIASTVESFRLMKADGTIVRCSRGENKELFSLALGGYGLFGIILDVELRVVANERLRLEQYIVPVDGALASFERKILEKPDVRMVYARLNISPDKLFQEVIISMFFPDPSGEIPGLEEPGSMKLRRAVFRGSAASAYGKKLRWEAETKIQPLLAGSIFSRNQLLNESADWYLDRSMDSTDILHEYFIPRATAGSFLGEMRQIIPKHRGDVLNVTVRDINTDPDTFLRYADQPVSAFVLFFSQSRTPAADARMRDMTREMIDASIRHGGRYYLPYRLHATGDQLHRAYPQARSFFDLKRQHDPRETFQNQFYLRYGGQTVGDPE